MRRGALTAAAGLAVLLGLAPGASARDATVTSFDGTKIVTHFFPAEGLGAGERAPTVLLGHGYGMSGDTSDQTASDTLFGKVGTGPLHRSGYNVLTWDARGFGGSGGQVMADSPEFEGRDVQALISHVARQPEARLDAAGDPRVGMNGPSYGGGIQLTTAAIDKRVDAITPTIAWNSLVPSLYKDEIVKQGWGSILFGAGGTAFTGGIVGPSGPETGSTDPAITKAFTEGSTTGRFSPESVEFFRSRGPGALVDRIRIPTLLLQGTVDTLFTLKESMVNHAILKANGVPVRMVWFCGGHGACLTDKGPISVVEESVISWFDRWLKGNPGVNTGPPFSFIAQDGKLRNGTTFPPVPSAGVQASGSGTLPLAPSSGGGALIFASPSAEAVNVDLPAPKAQTDLLGEPQLSLTYTGTGTPEGTHVFAQIVDTASNLVVGNQATPIPVTLDGKPHTIDRPLEPIAYHAEPASRLRLQIAPSTTLYSQQRTTGTMELSKIGLAVPAADIAARPRLALRIGAAKGLRRARRGRPFRLRVRAVGATLRQVRIVLRNRRGRRVGRSRLVGLRRGRARGVVIRVSRRVPRGRFRFVARGSTAEGLSVKATKRLRVRRRR